MEPLFEAQKKKSTVDTVIDSIRQLLLRKKLRPGQKIPSEAEIAEGLAVSRGSVREAMKILSAFGIVDIKVGDGTYIASEPKSAIIDPLLFNIMLCNPDHQELSEFRKRIELVIVELIIEHKSENKTEREDLAKNLRELERLQGEPSKIEDFSRNDMDFHRLLGKACHNRIAQKVYDFVLDYLEQSILDTHLGQTGGGRAYATHSQILEAIRLNDIDLAKQAVYHSVDVWKQLQASEAEGSAAGK